MTQPVYLDTNIFIAAFETTGAQSDAAWEILDGVTKGRIVACTSELTLAELLPKPLALGSQSIVELYTGLLQSGGSLSVVEVSRTVLLDAAKIRASHHAIKLPDAIHLATALQRQCIGVVSDDRRLRGFEAVPIINLSGASFGTIMDLIS